LLVIDLGKQLTNSTSAGRHVEIDSLAERPVWQSPHRLDCHLWASSRNGRKADEETIAAFGSDDRSLPLKCRIWNRRMANDADGLVAMSDSPCREVKLGARKDGLRVYVHRV
jgi:hypothetical protein